MACGNAWPEGLTNAWCMQKYLPRFVAERALGERTVMTVYTCQHFVGKTSRNRNSELHLLQNAPTFSLYSIVGRPQNKSRKVSGLLNTSVEQLLFILFKNFLFALLFLVALITLQP